MCFYFSPKHRKQIQVRRLHKTMPVLETSKITGPWCHHQSTIIQTKWWDSANHFLVRIKRKNEVQLEMLPTCFSNYWIGQLSIFSKKNWGDKSFPSFISWRGQTKFPIRNQKFPQLPRDPQVWNGEALMKQIWKPPIFFLTHLRRWFFFFPAYGIRLESLMRNVWLEFISNGR